MRNGKGRVGTVPWLTLKDSSVKEKVDDRKEKRMKTGILGNGNLGAQNKSPLRSKGGGRFQECNQDMVRTTGGDSPKRIKGGGVNCNLLNRKDGQRSLREVGFRFGRNKDWAANNHFGGWGA